MQANKCSFLYVTFLEGDRTMRVVKYTALALSLVCCNVVVAQQQTAQPGLGERIGENRAERQENRDARQAERAGTADRPAGIAQQNSGQANNLDQFIATCLLIGNQEEVALAQDAVQRAENENVKQFAQMLVDDHQKAIQKLQQHAKPGISLAASGDATAATRPVSDQSNQVATNQSPTAQQYTANRVDLDQNSAGTAALDQVLKMQQQAAQECLTMTKAAMQQKQGAEFDKAFAGSQIGAHIGMLAKLKASQQHASPELASMINESEQTVQKHLDHAKQLCQELESMQASNR
jgi:predicted outer membrane protein